MTTVKIPLSVSDELGVLSLWNGDTLEWYVRSCNDPSVWLFVGPPWFMGPV
jgi:hypothetical protein